MAGKVHKNSSHAIHRSQEIFKNYPTVCHNHNPIDDMSIAATTYPEPVENNLDTGTGDRESNMQGVHQVFGTDDDDSDGGSEFGSDHAQTASHNHEPEAGPAEPAGDQEDTDKRSKELLKAAMVLIREAKAVHKVNGTQYTMTILKWLARAVEAIDNEAKRDAEATYRERLQVINQKCASRISVLTTKHNKGDLDDEEFIARVEQIQISRALEEQAAAKELESSTQCEHPDYQGVFDYMMCPVSLGRGADMICACRNNHVFSRETILELWRSTDMGIPTCPMCREHIKQVRPTGCWHVKPGKEYILAKLFPDKKAILPENKAGKKAGKKKSRAGSAQ